MVRRQHQVDFAHVLLQLLIIVFYIYFGYVCDEGVSVWFLHMWKHSDFTTWFCADIIKLSLK